MELTLLPGRFAVARLAPEAPVPEWASQGPFTCQVRTPDELSLVVPDSAVPGDIRAERDFACLAVEGPLAFEEVGVLAELARVLATAEVSILAISTFDTDYLLIRSRDLATARDALRAAGHEPGGPPYA